MQLVTIDRTAALTEGFIAGLRAAGSDCSHRELTPEQLSTPSDDIDIVLLSYRKVMERRVEPLNTLRRHYPKARLVCLFQPGELINYRRLSSLGINGFIAMNCDAAIARHALALVISGSFYLSPELLQKSPECRPRGITPRQRQIALGISLGQKNREIASELGLSINTVKFHAKAIMKAFDLRDRRQLSQLPLRQWHPQAL